MMNSHRILLSIIVPMYNSEATISRCIESILCQSFKNFELILVDDGSNDNTAKISLSYKNKDSRIVYYRKPNGGVSSARNMGIKIANGKYIQFVDSDDYLGEDYCNDLVNSIEESKSDIVITGYSTHKNGVEKKIEMPLTQGVYDRSQIAEYFNKLYFSSILNSNCNKLYKKTIVNVLFDDVISMGEDLVFNMYVFSEANNYILINSTDYFYDLSDNNSLSRSFIVNGVREIILQSEAVYKFLKASASEDYAKKHTRDFTSVLLHYYLSTMIMYAKLTYKEKVGIVKTNVNVIKDLLKFDSFSTVIAGVTGKSFRIQLGLINKGYYGLFVLFSNVYHIPLNIAKLLGCRFYGNNNSI